MGLMQMKPLIQTETEFLIAKIKTMMVMVFLTPPNLLIQMATVSPMNLMVTMMAMVFLMLSTTMMTMMAFPTASIFLVMRGNGDSDLDMDLPFSPWSFWYCPWSC